MNQSNFFKNGILLSRFDRLFPAKSSRTLNIESS